MSGGVSGLQKNSLKLPNVHTIALFDNEVDLESFANIQSSGPCPLIKTEEMVKGKQFGMNQVCQQTINLFNFPTFCQLTKTMATMLPYIKMICQNNYKLC